MIATPIGCNKKSKMKATTPDSSSLVTMPTPSLYFQSHHMLAIGIMSNHAVGMLAPTLFISFLVFTNFLMARDHRLVTAIFGITMRVIFAWQRRQAERAGYPGARPAAVGLLQR